MNENIDLTKILKGCPKGTNFYSSIFGEVSFVEIPNCYGKYPIRLQAYNKSTQSILDIYYTEDGRSSYIFDGECTLFPSKDQRDWSKFVRFWDKPKVEKFDVNTLQPFDKVLVRDTDYFDWNACLFSHVGVGEYTGTVMCDGAFWNQCIPYNEETKHLIGTNKDCPEYYKWWEE